ncbi:hypothetical protein C8R44DRAFT_725189 [Mycena epipterygia]|nr:hypothetical protein C8R44DRAFT_725189 [Mycena epipterygia]
MAAPQIKSSDSRASVGEGKQYGLHLAKLSVVQLYQQQNRRHFKFTHRSYAALGTLRFAHLRSNSFLAILLQAETVREYRDVEVGPGAETIFAELSKEREMLAKAVASLNTVRRKGKSNINIVDPEEEEELAE